MTLFIVITLVVAYVLIATEKLTNINKAAVAIFAGTLGWVLYVCYGTDFVMSQHYSDFFDFIGSAAQPNSTAVKQYIAKNVFLPYVARAAEVVLFLLSTMTIVEILNTNGCFDFISQLLKTRSSKRMLWMLAMITFVISANLDNLTTTVMMLIIMHKIVPTRRQRMLFGSAIVISANFGGLLTVIGNPEGLVLWIQGCVTPTNYSLSLLVPTMVSWIITIWWIGMSLPERVDTEWITMPYRGDDTRLKVWQRLLMLVVGIGGLWFIPTFHNITKLSPFLGALCVASLLWIVNELVNRKLISNNVGTTTLRRQSQVLRYGVIQLMLFIIGIILVLGVVSETGVTDVVAEFVSSHIHNVWIMAVLSAVVSTVLDNFATAMSMFSLYDVGNAAEGWFHNMSQNGLYWKVIAYGAVAGGNVLGLGSMSGIALMKAERMRVGWYFRNVGWKALTAGAVGLLCMWVIM